VPVGGTKLGAIIAASISNMATTTTKSTIDIFEKTFFISFSVRSVAYEVQALFQTSRQE
jgi:hypothetical protein